MHRLLERALSAVPAGLAVLICLTLAPTACTQDLRWSAVERMIETDFPGVPRITTDSLAARLADSTTAPPVLLDARTDEEVAVSHLPGARRIDPKADRYPALDSLSTRPSSSTARWDTGRPASRSNSGSKASPTSATCKAPFFVGPTKDDRCTAIRSRWRRCTRTTRCGERFLTTPTTPPLPLRRREATRTDRSLGPHPSDEGLIKTLTPPAAHRSRSAE